MAVQVQRGSLDGRGVEIRRRGALLPAAVLGVVVLAPLAALMSTVLLLGWQLQVIETESMEPRMAAGSLAVVEPLDAAGVRAGMVIVFEDPSGRERLVAHRAVKRLPGELPVWETKGDANARADAYPVHASAIRGRVRSAIPRLGAVVGTLHTPATAFLLIGVPLALLGGTELVVRRRKVRHVLQVYAIHDVSSTPSVLVEVFARSDDAERFISNLKRDQPARADTLVVIEQQLESGAAAGTRYPEGGMKGVYI